MKKPITLVENDGVRQLSMPNDLTSHLYTHAYLYLQPNGWFNDHPADEEGVTPWMTFPAVAFLKDILSGAHKVFEYGAGYSTLFFKHYAGEVVSVEHDAAWVDLIKKQAPDANIHLVGQNEPIHEEAMSLIDNFVKTFPQIRSEDLEHDIKHGLVNDEFAGYASTLYDYPKGHFNLIVLDGMARALTGVMAVERIAEDGLIILDNSDRWQYNHLQEYLIDKGYRRIDFWGPGFNNYHAWCTSIFSKHLPIFNHNLQRPVTEGPIFT